MTSPFLRPIRIELDRIAAAGRSLAIWWRDDDAVASSTALDRLLAAAGAAGAPLAIAAVPARVERSLSARLAGEDTVRVLVHGFSHANRAGPGAKSAEFGTGLPLAQAAEEMRRGLAIVEELFGPQAIPVLVPPWNRIAPDLLPALRAAGFAGMSTFGRPAFSGFPGLRVVNTHLDPVDWRGSRSLADPARLAEALRDAAAEGGPVGLLTHHLAFDEPLWAFTEALARVLASHPAIRFTSADALWPAASGLNRRRIDDLTCATPASEGSG